MADADVTLELPTPEGYSLGRSQRQLRLGARDPCTVLEDDAVWRATRTPDGPASFHAAQVDGRVRVRVWGEGAAWVCERAGQLLGLADDPGAFEPAHAKLRRLHARTPIHLPRTLRLFDRLVPAILHQLVTWREATDAYRGLVETYGEAAPGPGPLRLPPLPRTLARLPPFRMSEHGVLARQADTIRRAATTIHRLDPETLDPVALAARLEAIPGVGPWTSQVTLAAVLGHPDAVPTGDFHLPHTISWALAGEPRADDARMLELLEPFRGHRWRVICLVREAGIHAPRRGPRRGAQTRRRMGIGPRPGR